VLHAFAKPFGGVMPFWYAAVVLLFIIEAWVHWPLISATSRLLLIASVLWLLSILFTLICPVPINNRIASWDLMRFPRIDAISASDGIACTQSALWRYWWL
jgi:hypothetical protein